MINTRRDLNTLVISFSYVVRTPSHEALPPMQAWGLLLLGNHSRTVEFCQERMSASTSKGEGGQGGVPGGEGALPISPELWSSSSLLLSSPELSDTKSMSLKYEPSSEPLHNYAK